MGELACEPSLSGPATMTSQVTMQPMAITASPVHKRLPCDWTLNRSPWRGQQIDRHQPNQW